MIRLLILLVVLVSSKDLRAQSQAPGGNAAMHRFWHHPAELATSPIMERVGTASKLTMVAPLPGQGAHQAESVGLLPVGPS